MKKHVILTSLAAVLAITSANAVEMSEVVNNAKMAVAIAPDPATEPQLSNYLYDSTGDGIKDSALTSADADSIDANAHDFTYANRKGNWADLTLETATGTAQANVAIDPEAYYYEGHSNKAAKTYYGNDADIDLSLYEFTYTDNAGDNSTKKTLADIADNPELLKKSNYTYTVNQEFTQMTQPQTVEHEPTYSDYKFVDATLAGKTLADYMTDDSIDVSKTAGLDAAALASIDNAFTAYGEDHNKFVEANDWYEASKTAFDTISATANADSEVVKGMHGVYVADNADYEEKLSAYNAAIASLEAAQEAYGDDKDTYDYNVANADNYAASLSKVINDKVSVETTAREGAIAGEAIARAGADETLQDNIDAEAGARAGADEALQANIDAEAEARARADEALQNNIDNEVARAKAQEAAIRGEIAAADARTLASANAYTDKKVNTLEKNVSGGVAAATALSAVEVSNVGKGEVSVGGGYGYYNSQSAVAFGAAMGLSDSWSVNAGAGIASGDKTQVSFRAGTNYKFKLF